MRPIDLTFSVLRLPLDFTALLAAALTTYSLRFSQFFVESRPILQAISLTQFLVSAMLFALVWLALFAMAGLYSTRSYPAWNELGRIILCVTAGSMIVITVVFFQREVAASRFLLAGLWGLAIAYVWGVRLVLRFGRWLLLRQRVGLERLVIIGRNKTAERLKEVYERRPTLGYEVVKTIKTWNEEARQSLAKELRGKRAFEAILLADLEIPREGVVDLVAFTEENSLTFRYLADPFAARFRRVEVMTTDGVPMIEPKRTPLEGWGRVAKRLFDVLVSSLAIVLLAPIMLFVALAIKLDSRGGVFFSHLPDGSPLTRVGEKGLPFHYLKFRSMQKDQHFKRYDELAHLDMRKGSPMVKLKDDPRITRVGRFIRKWSIDELPEFFLVWLGRMSLVGPRPHFPEEVEKYKPHHRRALAIKPGITGLAQISGRSDLDFEEEIRLDTWYIENWSLWLDITILARTPWAVIQHSGVEEGV